jgi:hypothetical protein
MTRKLSKVSGAMPTQSKKKKGHARIPKVSKTNISVWQHPK